MEKGLTQQELADVLGITRLAVLNIEVGRRDPSYNLMLRWTEALTPFGSKDLWAGTRIHALVKEILSKEHGKCAPAA